MKKLLCLVIFISICLVSLNRDSFGMDNDKCMKCHGDDTIEAKTERGERINLFISEDHYSDSVHEKLKCIECHIPDGADAFKDEVHKIKENKGCISCHGKFFFDKEKTFMQSVHFEKMKDKFSCQSCHDSHNISSNEDIDMVKTKDIIIRDNKLCTDCHGSEKRYSLFSDEKFIHYSDSHDFLPNRELHWKSVRCIDCHTPENEAADFHNVLSAEKSQHNCVSCHSAETILTKKLYKERVVSNNFKFLKKGFFKEDGLIAGLEKHGIDIDEEMNAFVPAQSRSNGFINKYLFKDVYVIGATRNSLMDFIIFIIIMVTAGALIIHGLLRLILSRRVVEEESDVHISKEYLYTLNTRVWHWINAVLFLLLAFSGFLMHFGGLGIPASGFEVSVKIHNIAGPIMAVMYLVYVIVNIADGNYKNYIPRPKGFVQRWIKQIRFYVYGIFRGEPHPFVPVNGEKFNPLQKFAYTIVIFVLFIVLIATGIMLMYPGQVPERLMGYPGIYPVAVLHYITAVAMVLFLIVHLYLITTGDSLLALIRGMISGYHEHKKKL